MKVQLVHDDEVQDTVIVDDDVNVLDVLDSGSLVGRLNAKHEYAVTGNVDGEAVTASVRARGKVGAMGAFKAKMRQERETEPTEVTDVKRVPSH